MIAIGVLLVLWVLVAPIFALASARRANRSAEELGVRLTALEAALARSGEPPPAAASLPVLPTSFSGDEPPAVDAGMTGPWGQAGAEDPELNEAAAEPALAFAPPAPQESLESRIGARWSVLVGGLAMALGAIFLVRYSIEQGLLGPGTRIALGILLSAALFVAGEVLRRRDRAQTAPVFSQADVPAILTGAGGVAAFATIYAAHALYGFIGSGPAFVLLTIAGVVTLFVSVIHGPALAALGLLGSYAAPLLVSSTEPAPLPVVLHTLAVTGAVLALARMRGWLWLAIAGVAASLGWGLLTGWIVHANTSAAELLLVLGLTALYVGLLAGGDPVSLRDRPANAVALTALAGTAVLSCFYVASNPAYPAVAAGVVLSGVMGAVASRWTSMSPAALTSGAVAVLTVMLMHAPTQAGLPVLQYGALYWSVLGGEGLPSFSMTVASLATLVGIGCFLSAERAAGPAPQSAGYFAAAGAGAPLLILVVTYLRHVPFETRPEIGLAALALALLFAAATERLIRFRPDDATAPAPAFYAAGAVLALSFAASVGLATRFIPLALSLGAAGVAWVSVKRPVAVLPWLAVACAGLACAALVLGPPLSPEEIGTRPILNGLVLRFGLPALAVLFAGETLRRNKNGPAAGFLQAIGLALAAFFVVLEIRHYANGGQLDAGAPGLGEQSAITLAALAFSLGLQRIAGQTRSIVYRHASLLAGVAGAALIAVAHLVIANPLFTGEDVGEGWFFNLLLPGYLLPAIMAAWVAAAAPNVRPRWYVLLLSGLALALAFAYVTLMVRRGFHGGRLDWILSEPLVLDAENWTYSAVWLAFGIGLLGAGILLRSASVRAASGLVIGAVVCKVFLLDMSALTGALRAASFLGLGAVLIVIGRLYQRLMAGTFPNRPGAPADAGVGGP